MSEQPITAIKFNDRDDLAQKIAWEGGIWEALEYGITADQMPEGDTELTAAWERLTRTFRDAQDAWEQVSNLLPEIE